MMFMTASIRGLYHSQWSSGWRISTWATYRTKHITGDDCNKVDETLPSWGDDNNSDVAMTGPVSGGGEGFGCYFSSSVQDGRRLYYFKGSLVVWLSVWEAAGWAQNTAQKSPAEPPSIRLLGSLRIATVVSFLLQYLLIVFFELVLRFVLVFPSSATSIVEHWDFFAFHRLFPLRCEVVSFK